MESIIVEICRKNALEYSRKVCKKINTNISDLFPIYFDYPDHIAVEESEFKEYHYHLNKSVRDVETFTGIFEKVANKNVFYPWKEDWFEQTKAAAWIHDIGMIDVWDEDKDENRARDKHGETSARFLFKNSYGLDFSRISVEDRIKITLICLKHNKDWSYLTDDILSTIVAGSGISINEFKKHFVNFPETPKWELEFSGKLISTADCMRRRGSGLRNNLKQQFCRMSKCMDCDNVYDCSYSFCPRGCARDLVPHILIPNSYKDAVFSQAKNPGVHVYGEKKPGVFKIIISGKLDLHDRIGVRDMNLVNLRGDCSLSEVRIDKSGDWYNKLDENVRKHDNIIKPLIDGEHKTVLQVTLDSKDINASMFTFAKYIIKYLDKNLVIFPTLSNNSSSNKVILHIKDTNNVTFAEMYNRFNKRLRTERERTKFEETKKTINKRFDTWSKKTSMVSPVEVAENKLAVIAIKGCM